MLLERSSVVGVYNESCRLALDLLFTWELVPECHAWLKHGRQFCLSASGASIAIALGGVDDYNACRIISDKEPFCIPLVRPHLFSTHSKFKVRGLHTAHQLTCAPIHPMTLSNT